MIGYGLGGVVVKIDVHNDVCEHLGCHVVDDGWLCAVYDQLNGVVQLGEVFYFHCWWVLLVIAGVRACACIRP